MRSALRILIATAWLALVASFALGQTPTLVTGQVKDVNGVPYSFAQVAASLTGIPPNVNATIIVNGIPTPIGGQQNANADANGNFSMNLFCNTAGGGCSVISPSGTHWQFTVNENGTPPPLGTGPQTCSATVTITGASQNITSSFASCPALGNSSSGSVPTTVTSLFPAGKILAEYQFKPTETCAAAVDYSGNGNGVTGTVGTAPTIIPVTGGCNFGGNGALLIPAGLNSAQGHTLFLSFQSPPFGGQVHNVPIGGNSGGTLLHCNALSFDTSPISNGLDNTVNGAKIRTGANNQLFDSTMSTWNGTGVITQTYGTTQGGGADDDKFYINGVQPPFIATNASSLRTNQSTGQYQIGGTAAGSCYSTQSYFLGQIYWYVVWATEPTAADEALARNFIVSALANRGVNVSMTSNVNADQMVVVGDSISAGNGVTQTAWNFIALTSNITIRANPNVSNVAVSGYSLSVNIFPPYKQLLFPYLGSANTVFSGSASNAVNLLQIWAGTNDVCNPAGTAQSCMDKQSQMCRDWKLHGGDKCVIATQISRTGGGDTQKDIYDPVILNSWAPEGFDVLLDFAANPLFGADGAFGNQSGTNGVFQVDGIHPNQSGVYNIEVPWVAHAWNVVNANASFSTANTYTTTAPAPLAVTAATETGNTMTFTIGANTFAPGNCLTVAGVTPAGYNTPANMCTTKTDVANGSSAAGWNNVTGLTALTVAGTISAPQEKDADAKFSILGQCTTCTHTLEPAAWHLGQPKFIKITSTSPWTITPWQTSETINGGATFTTPVASATNNPIVRLDAIRGPVATGGVTWTASIQ